jgi:hypothetical protein
MNTMFTDRVRIKDLEATLANSTALLAVVGAGDLAVEKLRSAREQIVARSASFDPKAFRVQAQATIRERVEALQSEAQAAPEQIRALPERAPEWPAKTQALLADFVAGAFTTYGELAGRGKNVVEWVRGERPDVQPVTPVSRPATSSASAARTTKTATKKPTARKTSPSPKPSASSTTKSATSSASSKSASKPASSAKKSGSTPASRSTAKRSSSAASRPAKS